MHLKTIPIQFFHSEFSWKGERKADEWTVNIYVYLIVWIHYSLLSAIFIAFSLHTWCHLYTCCPYKCITYAGFQQIKKVPKAHEIRSEAIAIGTQVYFIDWGGSVVFFSSTEYEDIYFNFIGVIYIPLVKKYFIDSLVDAWVAIYNKQLQLNGI